MPKSTGDRRHIPLSRPLRRELSRLAAEKGLDLDEDDPASVAKVLGRLPEEDVLDLFLEANLLLHITEETAERFIASAERSRTRLEDVHASNEQVLEEMGEILARHGEDSSGETDSSRDHLVAEVRSMVEALSVRNTELNHARLDAEAALRVRGQFLANMSHEIRTPLNGMLGMTQLILETDLNPEQQRYLETVLSSGKSLERILNDILDYSKLDAEELVLQVEPFNLHSLLDDLIRTVRLSARSKGLETRFEMDPKVPLRIQGDGVRIRQVIGNLLDNAVKFTRDGWIALGVDLADEQNEASQRALRFTVDDSGQGIEFDKMGEVFLPFVQEDPSSTRVYGGAGLGLSIVLQLSELMGGSIHVASKAGEGSRFVLELPFEEAEAAVEVQRAPRTGVTQGSAFADVTSGVNGKTLPFRESTEEVASNGKPNLRNGSNDGPKPPSTPQPALEVLIVEDNEINQQVAFLALERLGHRCTVAANGREAVEQMAARNFPVVFMDLSMPVMDGLEATRRIRASEADATPPGTPAQIIAMTGNAFDQDRQRCFEAGMDAFLAKPFDLNLLEQILEEAIARRQSSVVAP